MSLTAHRGATMGIVSADQKLLSPARLETVGSWLAR